MAAVFASAGHHVLGLDVNRTLVAGLEAGQAMVEEPQLQELIDRNRERLHATTDYRRISAESDVTFIIVPTPSGPDGIFSNDYVIDAIQKLGAALDSKSGYHVVVVTSTVIPGSMDGPIRHALETASKKSVGSELGLCYNPEFIALGSVVENMLFPDFLLIGESDERAGSIVEHVYDSVCPKHPPVRRMNFVNAELAKISVNTFVTTKISYANMLADMCERLPGADVDVVAAAIGSDTRIGRKYLRGAVAYGGPCFPRDNVAFTALAAKIGARADIAKATDAINNYQSDRLLRAVRAQAPPKAKVAVLGMSYKPDTPVAEASQGVNLAKQLIAEGYEVIVHDPSANAAATTLGPSIVVAGSAEDALRAADIAVIVTPWPQYAKLSDISLSRSLPVIDCWRILSREISGSLRPIWLGYGERATISSGT